MMMDNDVASRSWFCVFNNPAEHGYEGTPEEVCNRLRDEWCTEDTPMRTGAWLYCVSEKGLHHIHMVLEDTKVMRFSKIKKSYAIGMHFEPTRGNKSQVEDYINKVGKFEEKGEEVLFKCTIGDLVGHRGKRTDLDSISDFIYEGFTPADVLSKNPNYYRYETIIRKMYFDKRSQDTPLVRDVKVIWHTGASGSGKSYSRVRLAEEIGEENIYYVTEFSNSSFDGYCGQSVLWLEDYRGEFRYGDILRLLDVYKADVHCRYTNAKALWNEVHITSIYHPKGCYYKQLEGTLDTIDQLLRRISCIRYHWVTNGEYKELDFSVDTDLESMRLFVQKLRSVEYEAVDL